VKNGFVSMEPFDFWHLAAGVILMVSPSCSELFVINAGRLPIVLRRRRTEINNLAGGDLRRIESVRSAFQHETLGFAL
jgi:hypothetical protein